MCHNSYNLDLIVLNKGVFYKYYTPQCNGLHYGENRISKKLVHIFARVSINKKLILQKSSYIMWWIREGNFSTRLEK